MRPSPIHKLHLKSYPSPKFQNRSLQRDAGGRKAFSNLGDVSPAGFAPVPPFPSLSIRWGLHLPTSGTRVPALLTKILRRPKASTVLVIASRSSVALALSALMVSALPPSLSISAAKATAFSGALEYVNATAIFSRISLRTIAAPIPPEPPLTRATRIGDELVSIIYFDEIAKLSMFFMD